MHANGGAVMELKAQLAGWWLPDCESHTFV
jgi:hypothetical protein